MIRIACKAVGRRHAGAPCEPQTQADFILHLSKLLLSHKWKDLAGVKAQAYDYNK